MVSVKTKLSVDLEAKVQKGSQTSQQQIFRSQPSVLKLSEFFKKPENHYKLGYFPKPQQQSSGVLFAFNRVPLVLRWTERVRQCHLPDRHQRDPINWGGNQRSRRNSNCKEHPYLSESILPDNINLNWTMTCVWTETVEFPWEFEKDDKKLGPKNPICPTETLNSVDESPFQSFTSVFQGDSLKLNFDFVTYGKIPNTVFAPPPSNRSFPFNESKLRLVVIHGENVGLEHGTMGSFSFEGLVICVNYFLRLGHNLKVFLPKNRRWLFDNLTLRFLEDRNLPVFTSSWMMNGEYIWTTDHRYMLHYAVTSGAIIVSNQTFESELKENPKWRNKVEPNRLSYNWVSKTFLEFPIHPRGENGPNLEEFLKFS